MNRTLPITTALIVRRTNFILIIIINVIIIIYFILIGAFMRIIATVIVFPKLIIELTFIDFLKWVINFWHTKFWILWLLWWMWEGTKVMVHSFVILELDLLKGNLILIFFILFEFTLAKRGKKLFIETILLIELHKLWTFLINFDRLMII